MIKNILMTSLATFTLLMSGCGGDSEGESVLAVEQMLDKGDFSGVIATLDQKSTKSDDDYLALGAAYMGKAGFSLTDVVNALVVAGDVQNGDTFAAFTKAMTSQNNSLTSYEDLDKAGYYYSQVVPVNCVAKAGSTKLSSSEQDVCLYIGLVLTSQASNTISLLSSDISKFGSNKGVDTKLKASACAMQYSVNKNSVDSECTVVPESSVTFTESRKTYERANIVVNGDSYDFLFRNGAAALTVGYCPLDDFSKRQSEEAFGYLPCPISETANAEDVTAAGVLSDTLNEGLDLVQNLAPSEMQGDVDEFKCDVLGGNFDGKYCSKDGEITKEVVINYLNKNN